MEKALGIFCGLVVLALIILTIQEHNRWVDWCVSQGGRVDSSTSYSLQSTVNANGQPGTTTVSHTTYYCLTDDGRIIDIKG